MSFNFMATVTISSDFGAQKIKSISFSTVSLSICNEVMRPNAMILGGHKESGRIELLSTRGED